MNETMDHRDLMVSLAKEHRWQRGVELGLGRGMLLHRLLTEVPDLNMVGVDLGVRADRVQLQIKIAASFPDRCKLYHCSTKEAVRYVLPNWADFIFIDAAHGYEAVREDIRLWQTRLAFGGWFGGHDYHKAYPGVMRAVDEAFGNRVKVLEHFVWTVKRSR